MRGTPVASLGLVPPENRCTLPRAGRSHDPITASTNSSGTVRPSALAVFAFDRNGPLQNGGCDRQNAATMPMLRTQISTKRATQFMTQ
jgi:hypothetical protein